MNRVFCQNTYILGKTLYMTFDLNFLKSWPSPTLTTALLWKFRHFTFHWYIVYHLSVYSTGTLTSLARRRVHIYTPCTHYYAVWKVSVCLLMKHSTAICQLFLFQCRDDTRGGKFDSHRYIVVSVVHLGWKWSLVKLTVDIAWCTRPVTYWLIVHDWLLRHRNPHDCVFIFVCIYGLFPLICFDTIFIA